MRAPLPWAAVVRDERGQTIVEWLGGLVLLTVLVLLVAAVKPSEGEKLRCVTGAQIDRMLSIDQKGNCNMGDSKPDPAQVRAILRTHPGTPENRADRNALRPSTP